MMDHIVGCDGKCKSPGKYEGSPLPRCLSERIHEISLDGCDAEAGSADGIGYWIGYLDMSDDDTSKYEAYIIAEDDRGSVSVEGFTSIREARKSFATRRHTIRVIEEIASQA